MCVTYMHTADGVADCFLSDVEEELAIIMKNPSKPIEGKVSAYLVSVTKFLTTQTIMPFALFSSFIFTINF